MWHPRRTLSAQGGALQQHLAELRALGARVAHGVDAEDIIALFYPFSQFCEIYVYLLSL